MTVKTMNNLGVLLRSYEALHNWRALVMLAGSFVLGGLVMSGGMVAGAGADSKAVAMLVGLIGVLIIVVGANASGLMLVDQAYDQPVRGFATAFLGGVQAALFVIGLMLLLALGFGVVMAVVFVLSLLGRIPGVGSIFGFLLGGPLVVVVAVALAVLLLSGPLMVAAVWHGEGFIASLSRAIGIVLRRPLEVFMHFLVLGLLVFPAVGFIFGLVAAGSMAVGSYFASGSFERFGGMGGMWGMGGMMSGGFGGAGVSISLVWFLAWAVVSLIYVLGCIFVYRAVGEGVGSEAADLLGQKLAQFMQKLDDNGPRPVAPPAAPAPAAPAPADSAAVAPAPAPTATSAGHCPACGAAVGGDDVFCGHCGHKLK